MQRGGFRFIVNVFDPIANKTHEETDGIVYSEEGAAEMSRQAHVRHRLADDAQGRIMVVGGRVEGVAGEQPRSSMGNRDQQALGAGEGMVIDGRLAQQQEAQR